MLTLDEAACQGDREEPCALLGPTAGTSPRPLRWWGDHALLLGPSARRGRLPFTRPGDNGGSPGDQGGADSGQGPQRQRGAGPSYLSPGPSKPCPAHTPHSRPSLSRAQASGRVALPSLLAPRPAAQPPAACSSLSPPCRLSEVNQSRKRAAGKTQVPIMSAEWEGTSPLGL